MFVGLPLNLHVAQDPGIAISIGVEVVENRLDVCLKHFFSVLQKAKNHQNEEISPVKRLGYNCYFLNMDVMEAASFDPFTHLYMFDKGFPPSTLEKISTIWSVMSTVEGRGFSWATKLKSPITPASTQHWVTWPIYWRVLSGLPSKRSVKGVTRAEH